MSSCWRVRTPYFRNNLPLLLIKGFLHTMPSTLCSLIDASTIYPCKLCNVRQCTSSLCCFVIRPLQCSSLLMSYSRNFRHTCIVLTPVMVFQWAEKSGCFHSKASKYFLCNRSRGSSIVLIHHDLEHNIWTISEISFRLIERLNR